MFTGIVERTGRIKAISSRGDGVRLELEAPGLAGSLSPGASLSLSGVCLTALPAGGGAIGFDVVRETLSRTTLGALAPGSQVNLESSVRADTPLGGHLVFGHVDCVASVAQVTELGAGREVAFRLPPESARYLAVKGSVAVDGVSLTVTAAERDSFRVALVPHTLEATTLGGLRPGDRVNIEVDQLSRYVFKAVAEILGERR